MVSLTFNIPVSGLVAAQTRLSVSANNVANAQTTTSLSNGQIINKTFTPDEVVQQSLSVGGTIAKTRPSGKDPVVVFDQNHPSAYMEGFVNLPDVDMGEERVNQILAQRAFESNLAVIKRMDEALGSVVDIVDNEN